MEQVVWILYIFKNIIPQGICFFKVFAENVGDYRSWLESYVKNIVYEISIVFKFSNNLIAYHYFYTKFKQIFHYHKRFEGEFRTLFSFICLYYNVYKTKRRHI